MPSREKILLLLVGIKFRFSSYYKYNFAFRSLDGEWSIEVGVGANSVVGDIYRFKVKRYTCYTLNGLLKEGVELLRVYHNRELYWHDEDVI